MPKHLEITLLFPFGAVAALGRLLIALGVD